MSNSINSNASIITFYTSSGTAQINYKDADENTQRMWDSLQNRQRPTADLADMGLHALSVASADGSIKDMLTLSEQSLIKPVDINSLLPASLAPLQDMELQYGSPTTFTYNGREFYVNHPDYESFLNDPDLKVGADGWLTKTTGTLGTGMTGYLIGRAVDAPPPPEPPKYTADFFGSANYDKFFANSARDVAKAGIDEIPAKSAVDRDVDDFVKSALDFFGMGKATQADIDRMKSSIVDIVKELAEMIKNGGEADINKLKNKVDIMGTEVSLSQLLEMRQYGKELTNQLVGENKEWLRNGSDRTADFARRGLIKSMGMSYGDQIGGAIGEMFKAAWGAEVDRHTEVIKNMGDYALNYEDKGSVLHSNILKNGAQYVYDVFSKIDTSSKENALKSFNDLSSEIDAAIRKFLNQYTGGVPGGLAAKMRSEVDSYFYDLMGFKSVNVMA